PPAAPPDNTGLVAGSGSAAKEEPKSEEVAKADPKKEAATEGRAPASVPSVKGPAPRPSMVRSAAAAARPAAPAPADTPAEPQSAKLRFGDPGFLADPISIDIAGVDINDILRFISDNYGENFILDRSVSSINVTVKVNDVPWNQVLESILKAN